MVAFRNMSAERRCKVQKVLEFTRTRILSITKEDSKLGASLCQSFHHNLTLQRVQYVNFVHQMLGFGYHYKPGHWYSQCCCFTEQPQFPLGSMVAHARASTHLRTCPRAPGHHLLPIMSLSSPSGAVQLPRTQSRGSLRIACSELPDPVHRPLVRSYA